MSPEAEALAAKLEALFSQGPPADNAAVSAAVAAAFPRLASAAASSGGDAAAGASAAAAAAAASAAAADKGDRASVANAVRRACQRLTQRAIADGASPLRWSAPGAPCPALPAFLDVAFALGDAGLTDHSGLGVAMGLLEDVADAASSGDCGDVLGWLMAREAKFRALRESKNPVLRLCNRVMARLSRASEPDLVAGLLVFLAKVFPLNERSGLNLLGATAPALVSAPEEVPPGAVDTNGQPVDALLYAATWGLQPLLHSPRDLAAPDAWARFVADARSVLAALATQPAQVVAGVAAASAGGAGGSGTGGGGGTGGGTVGYLASPQLFGLQLRDGTFRRALLVQILIALQAVRSPVRAADPGLRAKQLPEAAALEAEAYKALAATPEDGRAFAAAVRAVLEREEGWAQWKRGGPPPPTASAKGGKGPACPDYERPPLEPPLAARVAEGEAAEAAAEARTRARRDAVLAALAREKRSALEMDAEELAAPRKRIKTDSALLRGASRLDAWVFHVPDSNMDGLKVHERAAFPTLELLARPALEQMDPEAAIEPSYRLLRTDPVYRWRVARLMARRWPGSQSVSPLPPWMPPAFKDRLTTAAPDEVEFVLGRILPDLIPEAWVREATEKMEQEKQKQEAAKAAAASGGGAKDGAGGTGTAAATPTGTGGAGAAAGAAAGGDDATGAPAAADAGAAPAQEEAVAAAVQAAAAAAAAEEEEGEAPIDAAPLANGGGETAGAGDAAAPEAAPEAADDATPMDEGDAAAAELGAAADADD